MIHRGTSAYVFDICLVSETYALGTAYMMGKASTCTNIATFLKTLTPPIDIGNYPGNYNGYSTAWPIASSGNGLNFAFHMGAKIIGTAYGSFGMTLDGTKIPSTFPYGNANPTELVSFEQIGDISLIIAGVPLTITPGFELLGNAKILTQASGSFLSGVFTSSASELVTMTLGVDAYSYYADKDGYGPGGGAGLSPDTGIEHVETFKPPIWPTTPLVIDTNFEAHLLPKMNLAIWSMGGVNGDIDFYVMYQLSMGAGVAASSAIAPSGPADCMATDAFWKLSFGASLDLILNPLTLADIAPTVLGPALGISSAIWLLLTPITSQINLFPALILKHWDILSNLGLSPPTCPNACSGCLSNVVFWNSNSNSITPSPSTTSIVQGGGGSGGSGGGGSGVSMTPTPAAGGGGSGGGGGVAASVVPPTPSAAAPPLASIIPPLPSPNAISGCTQSGTIGLTGTLRVHVYDPQSAIGDALG